MSLRTLAQTLATELGPPFHLRSDYDFAIPSREGLSVARADAAIFTSAIPSIHTAAVGFHSFEEGNGSKEDVIEKFAYLGAPLLVSESGESVSLYKYSGASLAEKIDEQRSSEWVRARILRDIDSAQLKLPLASTRALLIQDTRDALERGISSLMEQAIHDRGLSEQDAFRVAMVAIRRLILLDSDAAIPLAPELFQYAQALARRVKGRLSFANVPAESIAELYERFAVTAEDRRRRGVVYTPAWLARYVVDRLPPEAFESGQALDPTCGSGTFLVCFLERLVERVHRGKKLVDAAILSQSVCGMDLDPVAIEAARLALDMFARSLGINNVTWNLIVADATQAEVTSDWLVGNLPFGYRTYRGQLDISSVILSHIYDVRPNLRALSLILPDSLAYAESARDARGLLRSHFNIQEITRLPERVFDSSTASTMVVAARKGESGKSVLVREVRDEDLSSFRAGIQLAGSFYSHFPPAPDDPWRFSPFSNEFDRASMRGLPLSDVAAVRVGLQIYGLPASALGKPSARSKRPLLIDPATFKRWQPSAVETLPTLKAKRSEVRRQGPWDHFPKPKIIVRSTTDQAAKDRLAAIPDTQGLWFTDKFVGIWPSEGRVPLQALAAYLQTRFVRAWYQTNNPSRKLRVRVLTSLPIPKLTSTQWARAAELAPSDYVVQPPQGDDEGMLRFNGGKDKEWEWFNTTVDAALGLDPVGSSRLGQWVTREGRDLAAARW